MSEAEIDEMEHIAGKLLPIGVGILLLGCAIAAGCVYWLLT